jgi:hypothetical protein
MDRAIWYLSDPAELAAALARLTPDEWLEEAVYREARGNLDDAEWCLRRALRKDEEQRRAAAGGR